MMLGYFCTTYKCNYRYSMPPVSQQIFKLFLSTLLITSCVDKKREVDISGINLELKISRLDLELFDNDESMQTKILKLSKQYGEFFARYTEDILNLGAVGDPALAGAYKQFVYDADISKVAKSVSNEYKDFSIESLSLTNAFKRYKVLFPNRIVPEIVTIISGFTYKIAATEKTLGIGLDMYLGENYSYYSSVQFPAYRKMTMERKNIVSDALTGWITTEFLKPDSSNAMIDEIIYEGKILYLLDQMLPLVNDEIKIGYSIQQLKWCTDNEMAMWGHFVNEKLLFSQIKGDYFKYVNDGPFTPGFDRASPSRTGNWLGWQIVRRYMENNPTISATELMNNRDAQRILNTSNYKPRK
tara:strand:- start:1575 stop:2642 length:1068 start_codon:yes stop_codon:yes gene_type:complete